MTKEERIRQAFEEHMRMCNMTHAQSKTITALIEAITDVRLTEPPPDKLILKAGQVWQHRNTRNKVVLIAADGCWFLGGAEKDSFSLFNYEFKDTNGWQPMTTETLQEYLKAFKLVQP